MKNKKICLVTGGAGFIGSNLVEKLVKKNFKVFVLDNLSTGSRKNIKNFKLLKKALTDFKPSIVFHLAAQSSVLVSYKNPLDTVSTNVMGTTNLLESIKNLKSVKSAVIVTTDKVYLNLEKQKKFKELWPWI